MSDFLEPVPQSVSEISPEELALKAKMFEQVVQIRHLDVDKFRDNIAYLTQNAGFLKNLARQVGYYYGMPPHQMAPELKDKIKETGTRFLQGTTNEGDDELAMHFGFDIFKTAVVDPDTTDFRD